MPVPRLYDALELIKQGHKQQAKLIVRDVLKQDRENVAAWWLMANLLEDEEKVLKCLYQILKLDPEHRGAQRKLASLRPDLAQQFAPPPAEVRETPIEKRLIEPPPEQDTSKIDRSILAKRAIAIVVACVGIVLIGAFAFNSLFNTTSTIEDDSGNTPQQVTESFIHALWLEDAKALYRLSCPDYHSEIEAIVASFSGYDYSAWSVDTSLTIFELLYLQDEQAYVTIDGVTMMNKAEEAIAVNWREEAETEELEGYGEHLLKIDGKWNICVQRTVPGIEQDF